MTILRYAMTSLGGVSWELAFMLHQLYRLGRSSGAVGFRVPNACVRLCSKPTDPKWLKQVVTAPLLNARKQSPVLGEPSCSPLLNARKQSPVLGEPCCSRVWHRRMLPSNKINTCFCYLWYFAWCERDFLYTIFASKLSSMYKHLNSSPIL